MDSEVYANMAGIEVAVSGSATVDLPWRSRQVIMVNDSSATDLEIWVGSGPSFSLKALETISTKLWIEGVRVSALTSTNFRLIGIG